MNVPDDDVSADIRSALTTVNTAPEPVAPVVETAAPILAPDDGAATDANQTTDSDRARGPDGKFVARTDEIAQSPTAEESTSPAEAAEPETAIRAPGSWKANLKARWSEIPRDFQEEIARRDREIEVGFSEQHGRLNRLNQFDEILKPHKEKWTLAGVSEFQGVKQLLAAQDFLERDPIGGLRYLAKSYGVDIPQLAQPAAGQQPQQAQFDPALQPILQELSTLKQSVTQREQAEAQREREQAEAKSQAIAAQIETFRSDPRHPYFENVQDEMGLLLQAGKAKDLDSAYEMACWANSEVRPLILADQRKGEAAEAAKRAAMARQAAGSVTGSPGPGVAQATANQNATVEDDLRASFREVSSRA